MGQPSRHQKNKRQGQFYQDVANRLFIAPGKAKLIHPVETKQDHAGTSKVQG